MTDIIKEPTEQTIPINREMILVTAGGAVKSVNGKTGVVVLGAEDVGALPDSTFIPTATSDIENDSGFITSADVPTKVSQLQNDSDFQTGSEVSQAIGVETTAREGADINLQGQIDAITASSDVKDIVGTYAALQSYDTSTLGNNDIIKVLQDENHSNETTYYRWSTTTQSFTLIGEEGPYYTKSAADTKFQDKLTAGSNITIDANNEISATDTTYNTFTGATSGAAGSSGLVPAPSAGQVNNYLKSDGTWGTPTDNNFTNALKTKLDGIATGAEVNVQSDLNQTNGTADDFVKNQFVKRYQSTSSQSSYGAGYIYLGTMAANDNGANFYSIELEGHVGGFTQTSDSYEVKIALANRAKAMAIGYLIGPGGTKLDDQFDIVAYQDTNATTGETTRWYLQQITSFAATDITVRYHQQSNFTDPWSFTKSATTPSGVKVYSLVEDIKNGGTNVLWFNTQDGTINATSSSGGGPTVVQSTGTSSTDVMSQVATSQMIYPSGSETNNYNIFIKGPGTSGNGKYISIGPATTTGYVNTNSGSTGIGPKSVATGPKSIAIAAGSEEAQASATDAIAIKGAARAQNSIAIGGGANVQTASTNAIVIGKSAGSYNTASASTCVGGSSSAETNSAAFGYNAKADGQYSTAIGDAAKTDSNYNVAVGYAAYAYGSGNIAIGSRITTTGLTGTVVIGNGAASSTAYATRSNEFCVHASTTANQPMIHSNVDTPTLGTDAANKDYVDTQVGNIATILQTINSGTGV